MREIAPFGVRMPPELKTRLESSAKRNKRSLNAELLARLGDSFEPINARHVEDAQAEYRITSEVERDMLDLFRRWPTDKQLSFLVLFK
ncbi:MAG: Arc family DNA-binding protein [Rhodocyclales bacterium]|nr:Arc family DNA-binding protein [Rhodocyclales bacterium]